MNDAKEVHRTLRAAAGIFETLKVPVRLVVVERCTILL